MSRTKKSIFLVLGVISGLGTAWLVQKKRRENDVFRIWEQALTRRYDPEKAQRLTAASRRQFASLLAETPLPENRILLWHLKSNIFPGLALYRVLLEECNGDQQAALDVANEAFRAKAAVRSRALLAPLTIMPAQFRVFKMAYLAMMKLFPAEGWDITTVEDSDTRIAFDITRCFYQNTLTKLGAPELTASFCMGDDVMAEYFPPSIRFIREHTLGRGDTLCDFQYCREDVA